MPEKGTRCQHCQVIVNQAERVFSPSFPIEIDFLLHSLILPEPDGLARHCGAARLPSQAAGGHLRRLRRRGGDGQDGTARQDSGSHGETAVHFI